MDNASWGALALALSIVAALWTWRRARTHGLRAWLQGVGVTLLPIAAYLTHTLRLLGRIVNATADWAAGLVFSPVVWVGFVVAGIGVGLILLGRFVPSKAAARTSPTPGAARVPGSAALGSSSEDDELAALLRKHGIS